MRLWSKMLLIFMGFGLVTWSFYWVWSDYGRTYDIKDPALNLSETLILGKEPKATQGSILAIQPWMTQWDYASPEAFRRKMEGYFTAARKRYLIRPFTIVVLPETIGTWLLLQGEKRSVLSAETVDDAFVRMILSNLGSVIKTIPTTQGENYMLDAVFRMKSDRMLSTYQTVFSGLAIKYGVSIIAGSIVLPEPSVVNGRIVLRQGNLYSAGFLFEKDGSVNGRIFKKVFPNVVESRFMAHGSLYSVPVFETELGKLSVLMGKDSWHAEAYHIMKEQDVKLVVVPAYLFGEDAWNLPWQKHLYSRYPEDIRAGSRQMLEKEAWLNYSVKKRLKLASAKSAVVTFMRGKLWNLAMDGRVIGVLNKTSRLSGDHQGAVFFHIGLQ